MASCFIAPASVGSSTGFLAECDIIKVKQPGQGMDKETKRVLNLLEEELRNTNKTEA